MIVSSELKFDCVIFVVCVWGNIFVKTFLFSPFPINTTLTVRCVSDHHDRREFPMSVFFAQAVLWPSSVPLIPFKLVIWISLSINL